MLLERLAGALSRWPKHPIDTTYGIETSVKVPRSFLHYGDAEAAHSSIGYVGSQPSIVRTAINSLPDVQGGLFLDLGCGKGRALVVALEFPFAAVRGIELSPPLAATARRNLAKVSRVMPNGGRAEVEIGDATRPTLPANGLVALYLYNPFRADLTARLLDHLDEHLRAAPQLKLFVISYNPTQAALFDAQPFLERYYAARCDFAPEETGASPFGNTKDSVVIWQSLGGGRVAPLPGADSPVHIVIPDLAAEVIDATSDHRLY